MPGNCRFCFIVPFFIVLFSLFAIVLEEYKMVAVPIAVLSGIGGAVVGNYYAERWEKREREKRKRQ